MLLLSLKAMAGMAATLIAALADDGTVLATADLRDGEAWCILWRHSVQGFEVSDCYRNKAGRMVLDRSHLPDFAAGLDHIPGRGVQISDGQGGYWIEDLDEQVAGNAYILRPGSLKVDHRLQVGDRLISLSELAARQRVRIALIPDPNR